MVVKFTIPGGSRWHGPPYTKAEEEDFYRRIGRGPVTVVHGAPKTREGQTAPAPQKPASEKKSRHS